MAEEALGQHPKTAQMTSTITARKSMKTTNVTVQTPSRQCCAEHFTQFHLVTKEDKNTSLNFQKYIPFVIFTAFF